MKKFLPELGIRLKYWLIPLLLFFFTQSLTAQDSKGTNFWICFPGNQSSPAPQLYITADVASTVTISIPGIAFNQVVAIAAGGLQTVNLPGTAQVQSQFTVDNKGIHITATNEVTVYGMNAQSATTDAFLAFPTDALGLQYFVLGYNKDFSFSLPTQATIVATQNNTTVTITTSVTDGGFTAGVPANIVLQQGEVYQLRSLTTNADYTGTKVVADKPVSVFGGAQCTNISGSLRACDHLVEQLPPLSAWGRSFVTVPLATRIAGDVFRFLAQNNGTQVSVNGVVVANLSAGQHFETILGSATYNRISSNEPILVGQYSRSSEADNVTSDPFFSLVPPDEQFLNSYVVSAGTPNIPGNHLNITSPTANTGTVRVDGVVVNPATWVVIPGTSFSGARVAVANGVHTITSTLPIGLLVYGFGSFDSYGYLGGQSFSAVATVTTVQLTPANGSSAVGSNQCFDALVRDQFNDPVSGVRVDFAVTGVNPGSSFVFTNASGIAQFCYSGTNAGADVITANVGGISDASNWTWNPVSTNVYYSKAAGDLHNVLTWGVNPDGSGANPPDFTAGKTFNLANRPGIYTMTGNWTVGGVLNNPAASQLRINGFTLSIASLTGPGTLSGSATSSLIVAGTEGGDAGTLNFTTGARMLNNFTINRTGAAASATLGTALDILSVLTATNGTLNTGGFLTLKSSASNTARVAPVAVTANINGSVTVERYIPARRAWRILSAPIMGTQTIKQSWQENAAANTNPNPGFGTNITGGPVFGSTANGFDLNPGAQSSIQSYTGTGWTALPNTNVNTVGTRALMLFVRGHRGTTLGLNTVPPTITTLRAKGPLNIGDRVYLVPASGFAAIPNPYASPINFATITRSNVANNFYLWDPKMGGTYGVGAYVNVSFNGVGYDVTPASVSPESQYIQSGQGFIVASTGVAGSLTIKESDKSATPATNVFRTVNSSGFRITLQAINEDHSTAVLDEAYNSYSSMYSSDIDAFDAPKLSNIEENLAILSKDKMLIVERRPIVSDNETIYLKLWNTTTRNYVFEFNPENMGSKGLYAVLHDKYLRTVTPIDLNAISQVYFTVNGDEASKNTDRFKVVFTKNKPGAVKPRSWLTIYPNPVSGSTVNVEFSNMDKGTYMVTLVNDLGQVIYNKPVFHAGGSIIQQIKLNHNLARGVYQIQVSGSGEKIATKIVSH